MQYLSYLIAFLLFFFGVIVILKPKKANRIIHVASYFLPFWVWGLIIITFSLIFWQFKTAMILGFFLLLAGSALIFYPNRKIKKGIEKWQNLPYKTKKAHGFVLIIFSFSIVLLI